MFLVIALGYAIGSVNIRGFNLGIGARTNRLDLSVGIARASAAELAERKRVLTAMRLLVGGRLE